MRVGATLWVEPGEPFDPDALVASLGKVLPMRWGGVGGEAVLISARPGAILNEDGSQQIHLVLQISFKLSPSRGERALRMSPDLRSWLAAHPPEPDAWLAWVAGRILHGDQER